MLHHFENEFLKCAIDSNGAEIRSLVNKKSGEEYIWQIKPEIWGSSSPVLFPAIGSIREGKQEYEGRDYAMNKHGIIRNNDQLTFGQASANEVVFGLESSPQTKKQYPFDFSFKVRYRLEAWSLKMIYEVENRGQETMYFICGGHTAYACPLEEGLKLTDYVVDLPGKKALQAETIGASGLLSYRQRNILSPEEDALVLSENLFNEDALIFAHVDFDWLRLRRQSQNKGLIIRFEGYPHLALWSKPGADYLCIEPWLGLPDREDESLKLKEKSSYHRLEAGGRRAYCIETLVET